MRDELQCVLIEYQEMRKEKRDHLQMQAAILTLFVTTCGIALTVTGSNLKDISPVAVLFILVDFIPAIITFFSVIWIDQVFRQVSLSNYIFILEDQLRQKVRNDPSINESIFNWTDNFNSDKKRFKYFYLLRYGVVILMFTSAIMASIAYGMVYFELNTTELTTEYRLIAQVVKIIANLVCMFFMLMMVIYCNRILKISNHEKQRDRKGKEVQLEAKA